MRTGTRSIIQCAFAVLIAATTANPGHAQVLYGSLTGNVTDPSSAAVPGAKVNALNSGTGISYESTTDDRGAYLFTNLQPGIFRVTVMLKSFKTTIQDSVQVSPGEVRRADFSLQIAQTTETVEISADTVVLQTDKADIHAQVTAQEIE